jgi:hypothetical protein
MTREANMLKSIKTLFTLGVGIVMISGCAADTGSEETVTTASQALDSCTGVTMQKWEHLANLAVATAQEMGQLNASQQFALATSSDPSLYGATIVTLSPYAAAFCAAKGGCPMVQSLLDIQEMPNDVYVPQALLNTLDYRQTLVDGLYRAKGQVNAYLSNNAFSSLAEDHSLTLVGKDGTATCGTPWYSFNIKRDFHITFSSAGPVAGMNCTQITEPNDPNGWDNNYLCSERNLGFNWSSSGAIAGMTCVNVNEGYDTDGWSDNYLCTPENWGLIWSQNGTKSGKKCIPFNEPSEPSSHGWANNYLCWDPTANLNHPASLCDEFLMFGGASACNGNNPYIDFSVSTDLSKIKIDPTDYTSGTVDTGSTGSCVTTLPYSSTAAVAGGCCYVSSSGIYGVLTKYPLKANLYYCKTT